jgi:hypothetical protein
MMKLANHALSVTIRIDRTISKDTLMLNIMSLTSFPRNLEGDSVVVHRMTAYSKKALWDAVRKSGLKAGSRPAALSIQP